MGDRGGSSLPLKQCATAHKQNAGRTLVPLNMSDFHFVSKINEQEYFLVPTIGVCYFSFLRKLCGFEYFFLAKYLKNLLKIT